MAPAPAVPGQHQVSARSVPSQCQVSARSHCRATVHMMIFTHCAFTACATISLTCVANLLKGPVAEIHVVLVPTAPGSSSSGSSSRNTHRGSSSTSQQYKVAAAAVPSQHTQHVMHKHLSALGDEKGGVPSFDGHSQLQ
jgi:predicted amidohydrolase